MSEERTKIRMMESELPKCKKQGRQKDIARLFGPTSGIRYLKALNLSLKAAILGKSEKGKNNKGKSEKGIIAASLDWDEDLCQESGQWVDITMKKVHRLLSMTDNDRKHVLDYTHVDLIYVEDQRKNMVNKYNPSKQELSIPKVNLENESLKDEIWTCSKVTLKQLLSEQIPGNIVKALGGKGRRKKNNPYKKVMFSKADVSTYESAPMITSDSEDDNDIQEPLPPLPKLTRAYPSGAFKSLISLSDLTVNMVDLTLNTASKEIKKSSNKVSQTYVIKKRTESKHPAV
ncbi:hypothetical protein Tco_0545307 [Tanacetum coccineum]